MTDSCFSPALHLAAPLFTFLVGGIPFGYVIGRLHGVDLREVGSRNIGATNAARTLGLGMGFLVFTLDALKGFLCILGLTYWIFWINPTWAADCPMAAELAWCAGGLACVLGHIFSPYLGFRGGKGVATAFGVLMGYWPCMTLTVLICLALWFFVLWLSRIVSLASLVAAACLVPIFVVFSLLLPGQFFLHKPWLSLMAVVTCATVLISHKSNISRLLKGQELKWTPKTSSSKTEPNR